MNVLHLVFVTKCRRPVFNSEALAFCEDLMRDVCFSNKVVLHELNCEPDHV
ncbi:transposase [Alteromonas facilis]|uniref:transposase n=1 Tax=Alteromonas facilis TaxID=2048004 RepID=UPI000C287713